MNKPFRSWWGDNYADIRQSTKGVSTLWSPKLVGFLPVISKHQRFPRLPCFSNLPGRFAIFPPPHCSHSCWIRVHPIVLVTSFNLGSSYRVHQIFVVFGSFLEIPFSQKDLPKLNQLQSKTSSTQSASYNQIHLANPKENTTNLQFLKLNGIFLWNQRNGPTTNDNLTFLLLRFENRVVAS